jgi:hypothetical protein
MCCLKYEHPLYVEFAEEAPAVGAAVTTPEGDGVVVGHSVPADAVLVRMNAGGAVSSCSRAGVCGSREVFATRTAPVPDAGAEGPPAPPRKRRQRRHEDPPAP